jgi:hypothetical protein
MIPGIVDQIKTNEKSEIPKEKFPFTVGVMIGKEGATNHIAWGQG